MALLEEVTVADFAMVQVDSRLQYVMNCQQIQRLEQLIA
jgi:hypothetical protein